MKRCPKHCHRGVTLIELVVAITVVAIAIASVLSVLSLLASRSADAMIRTQAGEIAAAYLNEVLQKSYQDPNGIGEAGRINFDDINDYAGLNDVGVHDQAGNAIAGLDQFDVSVAVGQGTLSTVPAAEVRRIDVTVSRANVVLVVVSGYRTRYP